MISTYKNAATSGKVTALRIHAEKERTMQDQSITQPAGVLEACETLIGVASQTFEVRRHGFIFEKSGDSMAVFDGRFRIDRRTLRDCSERAFLEAIDAWELDRYLEVA